MAERDRSGRKSMGERERTSNPSTMSIPAAWHGATLAIHAGSLIGCVDVLGQPACHLLWQR